MDSSPGSGLRSGFVLSICRVSPTLLSPMTPEEQNFQEYKRAETKALELLDQMRKVSPKKVDIELALLTALFELHKGVLPPKTVGRIVETHLQTLIPFYEESLQSSSGEDGE